MDTKEYVFDQIKRLTKALYRVTNLLSDKEPLKWTLRDKAIDIYNNFLKDKNADLSDIINILDLFSFDELSISNLNYDILKKEYKNLMSFIEKNKESLKPSLIEIMSPIEHVKSVSPIKPTKRIENNNRKEKIIGLLSQGPKNISEITPFFQGIGGKSIQRDLIDLVKLGKVTAEGEKRWRKYRLLTNVV